MSANSKPPAPTIKRWLEEATAKLQSVGIASGRLDAELILAHALRKERTWLLAHADELAPPMADTLLKRRLHREPLAYIRGYKEFYGRNFAVTPDTLIPRPETETLIELVKHLPLLESPVIHDVGTGSGCIAITLALELPNAGIVSASDYSDAAVKVARENAKLLGADVAARRDDLMETHYTTGGVDVIVANLPYVDASWEVSEETHAEPSLALYAADEGLALIKKLIEQATTRLIVGGYLVLEADPRQHDAIIKFAHTHGFDWYQTDDFIVALQRSQDL